MPQFTVGQLAGFVNGTLFGDAARSVVGINSLVDAVDSDVSFCTDAHYVPLLAATRAAAVLVPRKLKLLPELQAGLTGRGVGVVVVEDVDLAVNALLESFAPPVARPVAGFDMLCKVDPTATIGPGHRIGPFVTVGARAVIGARAVLHSGVHIGDDTRLGDDCELFPNVVVRERCTLGDRVVIHAGSVIGSDGFGYRWDGRRHAKVPQIGTVTIGSDVEIGSCSCVDRAKFSETVVGPGTKIDNLVQVGHNVRMGAHCIIVGQVGLAGSVGARQRRHPRWAERDSRSHQAWRRRDGRCVFRGGGGCCGQGDRLRAAGIAAPAIASRARCAEAIA